MKLIQWIKDKLIQPVKNFFAAIAEDKKNYSKANENEKAVFESHCFSCYKGTLIVKTAFSTSFSFGFIGLSKKQQNISTLKHEYGHKLQLKRMGFFRYLFKVACPSVTINILHRIRKLPYEYYSYPWEKEADELGKVSNRKYTSKPLPNEKEASYSKLVKLFFKRTEHPEGKL